MKLEPGSIYALGAIWVFFICGAVQVVKILVDPIGLRAGDYITRKISPIFFGVVSAPFFGPTASSLLGFPFDALTSCLLFGPGAGLAAMGAFAMLPEVFRDAINAIGKRHE